MLFLMATLRMLMSDLSRIATGQNLKTYSRGFPVLQITYTKRLFCCLLGLTWDPFRHLPKKIFPEEVGFSLRLHFAAHRWGNPSNQRGSSSHHGAMDGLWWTKVTKVIKPMPFSLMVNFYARCSEFLSFFGSVWRLGEPRDLESIPYFVDAVDTTVRIGRALTPTLCWMRLERFSRPWSLACIHKEAINMCCCCITFRAWNGKGIVCCGWARHASNHPRNLDFVRTDGDDGTAVSVSTVAFMARSPGSEKNAPKRVRVREFFSQTEQAEQAEKTVQTDPKMQTAEKKKEKVFEKRGSTKRINKLEVKPKEAKLAAARTRGFNDPESLKQKARQALIKPPYNVFDYYHDEGIFQQIARSLVFDYLSLTVVCLNAIWIAIDADLNDAAVITNSPPIFIVVENLFCTYFFAEVLIRFMAFEEKYRALRDRWFVFDSTLVPWESIDNLFILKQICFFWKV